MWIGLHVGLRECCLDVQAASCLFVNREFGDIFLTRHPAYGLLSRDHLSRQLDHLLLLGVSTDGLGLVGQDADLHRSMMLAPAIDVMLGSVFAMLARAGPERAI